MASAMAFLRRVRHSLVTLHTNTLASWMVTFGSATSADRLLTTSPVATPLEPQCQGRPEGCTLLSLRLQGGIRAVPAAPARVEPPGRRLAPRPQRSTPSSCACPADGSH